MKITIQESKKTTSLIATDCCIQYFLQERIHVVEQDENLMYRAQHQATGQAHLYLGELHSCQLFEIYLDKHIAILSAILPE